MTRQERIARVTGELLDDYRHDRYIDRGIPFTQPDKESVIRIIDGMQKLLFPGFFKDREYRYYTIENSTSTNLEDILYHLTRQISLALCEKPDCVALDEKTLCDQAEEIAFAFLEKVPLMRSFIDTDLQAEYDGDPAAYNKDEIIFSYPGFYAVVVYRMAHELLKLGVPMLPRIMTEYAHSRTGIDINPGAVIGKYFFIDHGTGVVIGETAVIGEHVKVYQGVTIGALSTRKGQLLKGVKRHPTIGDNVTIYAGASILGGETVIGEGAVIGANAFITSSVPAGARISMVRNEDRSGAVR